MGRRFIPRTDRGLLAWADSVYRHLAKPDNPYEVPPALVASFSAAYLAYAEIMKLVGDPGRHTRTVTASKNEARETLKIQARFISSTIHGNPIITDAQKLTLGLTVRTHQPIDLAPVMEAPSVVIEWMRGRVAQVRLRAAVGRGRAAGSQGAMVYIYYGEAPPTDVMRWSLIANTGKTRFPLTFTYDKSVQTAWLTARWYAGDKTPGPSSRPVRIDLPAATPVPGGEVMQLAA